MSDEDRRDFLGIATQLELISALDAKELQQRIASSGSAPAHLAMQSGFMDPVQIDIVETLLRPLEVIPGYEIVRMLGRGGMGVVYLARQLNLNREVALKTIIVNRMSDKSIVERFEQEAQTVGKLRHPNIVTAFDFGRHEGRLYLAMELVDGEDAESRVNQSGPLDDAMALGVIRQTAAGLSHAAAHDVVHRDIKPANLLLIDAPEGIPLPPDMPMVKIADFGLAFLSDQAEAETRLTSGTSTVGSPHYVAPEQLDGQSVDFRADIYSLGATAYHLLAGHAPFAGRTLSQIVGDKLQGKIQSLKDARPHVSTPIAELVERMMASDPVERFDSYHDLLAALDACSESAASPAALKASASAAGPHPRELNAAAVSASDQSTSPVAAATAEIAATQVIQTNSATTSGRTNTSGPRMSKRLKPVRWLAGIGVALALAILIQTTRSRTPVRVPMKPSLFSQSLFTGTSTAGWTNRGGNWVAAAETEGGSVLAGTNGVCARPLILRADELGRPVAPAFYRIDCLVHPHQAVTVAFHFSLAAEKDGERTVVEIREGTVTIGHQNSDRAELRTTKTWSMQQPFNDWHAIVIERLPTGWFVKVDDIQLDAVRLRRGDELPEFRVSAEGGPAWFSDLHIQELTQID